MSTAPLVDLVEAARDRKQMLHNGYPPIALVKWDDDDPKAAGKKPILPKWTLDARRPIPHAAQFDKALVTAPNTGFATHGLRVFDLDCGDPGRADTIEGRIVGICGYAPVRIRENSSRRALVYRAATGEPRKRSLIGTTHSDDPKNPDKVEVLGNGQQLAAFGRHKTGAAIAWRNGSPLDTPRDQLTAITEAQVQQALAAVADLIGAKPPAKNKPKPPRRNGAGPAVSGDLAKVHAVLMAVIPSDDYALWIKICGALWNETQGSDAGFKVFHDWSAKSENYPAPEDGTDPVDVLRGVWDSMETYDGERAGYGSIFHIARQHGWDPPDEADDPGYQASLERDDLERGPWRQSPPPPEAGPSPVDPDDPRPEPDPRVRRREPPRNWPDPVDCFTPMNTSAVDATEDELPPALWPFVHDTAERMGVACSTVALSTVVTCASVITDDWIIQPKQHDWTWTECARLWGIILGPPSILKTPIIMACTKPIERMEAAQHAVWRDDLRQHTARHTEWKQASAGAKKNGEPFDETEPQPPKRPRWLIESTSIEALQEVLRTDGDARFVAPAKKVLVRQDELSEFFANMDRYSTGRGGGDRGAYIRLYNGGSYQIDRIGRGSFTSNWSGCLLGGIQPEPIRQIAKKSADDGLLQRPLYDVPEHQRHSLDRIPNRAALERYERLIPTLATLTPPRNADGYIQPVVLHADAQAYRASIEEVAENMAAMPDISPRLKSAFGKWPGQFARLCLTFHLIEVADAQAAGNLGPPLIVVSAAIAERVARYTRRVLLRHLLRAEAMMFATVQSGHVRWIAGHILANQLDRITVRDVYRAYNALAAPEAREELVSVMTSLVNLGWLDPEPPRNPLNPVTAWQVNPLVRGLFDDRAGEERRERRQRQEDTIARRTAHGQGTR